MRFCYASSNTHVAPLHQWDSSCGCAEARSGDLEGASDPNAQDETEARTVVKPSSLRTANKSIAAQYTAVAGR